MQELLAPSVTTPLTKDASKHPCFNKEAKGSCGRVHLPVAPKCNIQCNFCNRKYDCINESRPGVTSAVLSPVQAVHYVEKVLEKEPRITVVGIAGPGDPMANADKTIETMRRLNAKYPQLLFCMSTNGLGLPAHVDELAEVGVSHITVTVNAVDPEVGQHLYAWVKDEGQAPVKGLDGAKLLLERQLEGIRLCKEKGMVVKVNTIVIPGVNEDHIEDVAKKMKSMGVDILNCMGLKPVEGTIYADIEEPKKAKLDTIRDTMEQHLPQMRHCQRCRADAVGLLTEDRTSEMAGCLTDCSTMDETAIMADRPYVAVCTQEGLLVNRHLGESERFQIWGQVDGHYQLIESRDAPPRDFGPRRWVKVTEILHDCQALLCAALGDTPRAVLEEAGIACHEMQGLIDQGLKAIFEGGDLSQFRKQKGGCKMAGCTGGGDGC